MLNTNGPLAMALASALWIIGFYFTWVKVACSLSAIEIKLNIENLTPSDYSVMLVGVPPLEKLTEEELKTTFTKDMKEKLKFDVDIPVEIAKIVFAYDMTPFNKKMARFVELTKIKACIDNYRESYKGKELKSGRTVTEEQLNLIYPTKCNFY